MSLQTQSNRQARITTPLGTDAVLLTRFTAHERLSEPFTIVADAIVVRGAASLQSHLGDPCHIEVSAGAARSRMFHGRLWEVQQLGADAAGDHYRLTLKPWSSFLDINCESRIYQNKTVQQIAQDVIGRRGGVSPQMRLPGTTYPPLEYCVQWQESDFDFLARLFERHGIYYHFEHSADKHELVASDDKMSHTANPGLGAPIPVLPPTRGVERPKGVLTGFVKRFEVAPVKASTTDYDFLTPAQKLKATKDGASRTSLDKAAVSEIYVHPGGFTTATGKGRGQQIGDRLIEAARADTERALGEGDVFAARTGSTIKVDTGAAIENYLIAGTTHHYTGGSYGSGAETGEEMTVELELIPAATQFRPTTKTPRPRIYGPQTAIVVGKAGEEIDTDEHGRVKVQFHWDRLGQNDEKSSCWIRVAQTVAGPNWGGFALPRIGQEVIVEFIGGDPDCPLVTGAVYNGQNKPPYPLPANKTRTTFKSRSTPKASGFNELRMEDKAGQEEVFFNAEKDLNSIVDKGNETRTLNKGNRDTALKIGNDTLLLKQGNRVTTLDVGNDSITIKTGNQTVKINLGKQETEAMQSIELKCGMSTVKLEPAKITLNSLAIEIKGTLSVKVEGVMVQSTASGISQLKGSLVQIN